jgi:hypothetical protein
MNDELFAELMASVAEAGRIERGEDALPFLYLESVAPSTGTAG